MEDLQHMAENETECAPEDFLYVFSFFTLTLLLLVEVFSSPRLSVAYVSVIRDLQVT